MGSKSLKEIILLFIVLSTVILPAAGSNRKFIENSMVQVHMDSKGMMKETANNEKATGAHPRMLKVNTKDYDSFDPAPVMVRPPFKLIPN